MKVTTATAPGKIILFGEHAVVYGRPAIAAPVTQLRALAKVMDTTTNGVRLLAPDLDRDYWLREAEINDPFARAVRLLFEAANIVDPPNLNISVKSAIPIASGLGSGAALAAAVIRSLIHHLDLTTLDNNDFISQLTYQVEKLLHGTPSGIDNTVVVYEQPVFFLRQQPQNRIEALPVGRGILILIAGSGIPSSTKEVVADVRRRWLQDKARFDRLFNSCGEIAEAAKQAVGDGQTNQLGQLMNENHELLVQMRVSSPELDHLVIAARSAGALGAKMSGGGRGGNMIALVDQDQKEKVRNALITAGGDTVFTTILEKSSNE